MPVINIAIHKINAETKTNLIRNLTATAVETTGVPEQYFTVLIQELDDANIGCAGKTRTEMIAAR